MRTLLAALLLVVAAVGQQSSVRPYGWGCGWGALVPQSNPYLQPVVGRTFSLHVDRIPIGTQYAFMATSTIPLTGSIDLSSFGMPGCALFIPVMAFEPIGISQGSGIWWIRIPNDVTFVGMRLYNQAIVYDATVGNPAGAWTTNAAESIIGLY